MDGYGSRSRTVVAAVAGGLGFAVAGERLAWALFSLNAAYTGMRADGYIAMIVLAPAGVVICGVIGAIAAARSPRYLGAVLGAGVGSLLASQLMVVPGYLGRPFESVLSSYHDPVVILVGGAAGAMTGGWLVASVKSTAWLIGAALVAYAALYLMDNATRWSVPLARLQLAVGRSGDVDLSGARLSYAAFADEDLSGVDLSHAELAGTDLNGADLSGADLTGAFLGWARLRGADLSHADLSGADLRGSDLSGANLDGAQVTQPQLDTTVSYGEARNLPDGLRPDTRPTPAGYPDP
jgi:hypothetical protein